MAGLVFDQVVESVGRLHDRLGQREAIVFPAGHRHFQIATAARYHQIPGGPWSTPGGAKRAAERAGYKATIHSAETAKAAIQRLRGEIS